MVRIAGGLQQGLQGLGAGGRYKYLDSNCWICVQRLRQEHSFAAGLTLPGCSAFLQIVISTAHGLVVGRTLAYWKHGQTDMPS